MDIKRKEENKLLGRTEVLAEITFEGATPSRDNIRKQIASELKTDEKLVIVNKIDTKFGETTALIEANVYKKGEELKSTEALHAVKRHEKEGAKEEAPAAEAAPAAPEAPAEEKPAEEAPKEEAPAKPVEEPKAEEKPAEEAPKEKPTEEAKPEEKPTEPKAE